MSADEVKKLVVPARRGPARLARSRAAMAAAVQESVIVSAAALHGVRVALSFDNVDRVRGEIKQETKRVRRARKAEVKAALRFYREHGGESR